MNFLEQLVAEWYGYRGYYTRTNVRVGRLRKGGYEGELDVVAFKPDSNQVVHIETSSDASSWEKRGERYRRKFELGAKYIPQLFNRREMQIEPVAILGYGRSTQRKSPLDPGIRLVLIPEFICQILSFFRSGGAGKTAVPEGLPLIRAMQCAATMGQPAFLTPKPNAEGQEDEASDQ